jgi:hypothetical protein
MKDLAQAIHALINSRPCSPRVDELEEVIGKHVPAELGQAVELLVEALRMFRNHAFIAVPHPDFHQAVWELHVVGLLHALGRHEPELTADERALAIASLRHSKDALVNWVTQRCA